MRLLHTSDWHLGRALHGASLLEEQAHALDQVVAIARDEEVDAVIIAGDIYDRAVPPAEAVTLLGETLRRLCLELGCQVIAIAGNHDSPERLGFAAELLGTSGLHLIGPLDDALKPVTLSNAAGDSVDVFGLPYSGPLGVRQWLQQEVSSHAEAMSALLDEVDKLRSPGRPTVITAHCFVTGGEASDSERPLSVGGAESVPAERFLPYTYVALGHLHRPQRCLAPHIRYSGSLLKYSFSEVAHRKSVTLVDISGQGEVTSRQRPLTMLRDLRVIEGDLERLMAQGLEDPGREDYLLARLTDTEALLDVMGKLRGVYPNVLQIQLPAQQSEGFQPGASQELLRRSQLSIFSEFFCVTQGESLSEAQLQHLTDLIDSLQQEGRL